MVVNFQLPPKDQLHVMLRSGGKGHKVTGDFKDNVYESLSQKIIVRARIRFSTEAANYQVLDYKKHGDSAVVTIVELLK